MLTIRGLLSQIEESITDNQDRMDALKREASELSDHVNRSALSHNQQVRLDSIFKDIDQCRAARRRLNMRLEEAKKVAAEEAEYEARLSDPSRIVMNTDENGQHFYTDENGHVISGSFKAYGSAAGDVTVHVENGYEVRRDEPYKPQRGAKRGGYDQQVRIGSEPRVYGRDSDPGCKGEAFLSDVLGAIRGIADSQERLARHQREWQVDNPKRQMRAAGDVISTGFPNLVVPQYLVDLYAAKPSSARPFADMCTHQDLPDEGMTVELAKGNTVSTAALQSPELSASAGTSHDGDPLTLNVQTAESWEQVSLQAIQRGRVTEQIIMNDLLDGMHSLIDSTLLTQAMTGLFAAGTRITYDDASPSITALYPNILKGASQVQQSLLNRGAPTHVVMHPRRWFWLQGQLTSTWPWMSQPGVPEQSFGVNDANAYARGRAGRLPCGLDVIVDSNVQTACLAGAQTGGTQDTIYVVPQSECLLFEPRNREVFIRAEQPLAKNLGLLIVVYEFFTYTFQRYAATALQHIDGTGTVGPAGY